jgi:hypothetical protein
MAASSDDEGGEAADIELDVVLGVRLASPKQAAAWAVLQDDTVVHTLRAAWRAWRAALAPAPRVGSGSGGSGSESGSESDESHTLALPEGDAAAVEPAAHAVWEGSDDEGVGGSSAASTPPRAPPVAQRVAVWVTARRLRRLLRALRALRAHAWLQREVWRRGHKALLAHHGARRSLRGLNTHHNWRGCARALTRFSGRGRARTRLR